MSQKKLTLSLVIPVFNEEGYLAQCLKAVAEQSVQPDEIIIVDNNSSDSTARLAKRYKHIRLLTEAMQGVYFARTHGFNAARGDIIARIDADTILPPDWVKTVLADFAEPEVTAVSGPVTYYDMPLPGLARWFDHKMRKYTYQWSPSNPFLYGSNMAVRRSAWRLVAGLECTRRDIHEDIDLAIHLYLAGKKIVYDKNLRAGASGRRMNETPTRFFSYIWMYRRTFHSHQLYPLAAYWAMMMWSLGYILAHPWLRLWYRLYERLRPGRPVTYDIRKNPMADAPLSRAPAGSKLSAHASD